MAEARVAITRWRHVAKIPGAHGADNAMSRIDALTREGAVRLDPDRRSRGLFTSPALQLATQVALPTLRRCHPRPDLPGRVVAHVLGVPALELGDPVLLLILNVAHDTSLHGDCTVIPSPLGPHRHTCIP